MKLFRCLIAVMATLCMAAAGAAESLESSPWVGWRQGYDCYDRAGAFRDNGEWERAAELYEESKNYFSAIARNFPDWNKAVVAGRIRLCEQEIAKLRKSGARKTPAPAPAVAPTHEEFDPGYEEITPERPAARSRSPRRRNSRSSGSDYADSWDSGARSGSRVAIELEAELSQYRQRLRSALQEIDNLQLKLEQAEARIGDVSGMMRDYRQLQEKYNLLAAQYRELKANAAASGSLEAMENQLMELKTANDEAQRTIRKLNAGITAQQEEYAASRREVLALKEKNQQSQNEVKRLEREVERVKRTGTPAQLAEELNAKIAALNQELEAKEKEIAALLKRFGTPGAAGNAEDWQEIARLRQEVQSLKAAGSAEKELRTKVSSLTAENERLTKQLQEAEARQNQQNKEYAALMNSTAEQNSARSVQSAELKSLRQHTAELEAELKTWSQRYAGLEKRYNAALESAAASRPDPEREKAAAARLQAAEEARRTSDEKLAALQKELAAAQKLVKESREAVIEHKAKVLEKEVELQKMAALQKAYDELKAKWELAQNTGNSDVLAALKRIPGLEESLRRYDAENKALLKEINALKLAAQNPRGKVVAGDVPKSSAELEKIETLLADARAAEARSNVEVAIWGYRQVLGRDAENAEASRNLGMLLLAQGRVDEAAAYLKNALRREPGNARTANALARALIGKRDYAGALETLHRFKAAKPGAVSRDLQITEALAYSRSGKNAEAETAFKAVLKLDPHNVEAAHELALLLSADEARRKEAGEYYLLAKDHGGEVDSYLEEVLKSVTDTDRATLDFLTRSATDALRSGDWNSAEWYVSELEKMAPGKPAAARLHVLVQLLTNRPQEALARLPQQDADRSGALLRAAVLAANGRLAEAEKLLKALPAGKAAPELQLLADWCGKRAAKIPAEKAVMELLKKSL